MADATEDTLVHPPPLRAPHQQAESDSDSDEDEGSDSGALDYRLLAHLTKSSALPKRGSKDFEPHPTNAQSSKLQASRDAMTDAISHTRVHTPKQHVQGFYDHTTGMTRILRPKGTAFSKIGVPVRSKLGGTDLYPEEALWALESGRLDVRWKGEEPGQNENDGTEKDSAAEKPQTTGIPMSLQAAYATYLGGPGNLTSQKYTIYAGLKRSGFNVLRAEGFTGVKTSHATQPPSTLSSPPSPPRSLTDFLFSLLTRTSPPPNSAIGPIITPGLYRTYPDIHRRLRIIPAVFPSQRTEPSTPASWEESQIETTATPFTTTFNVYRAHSAFKKSKPGPPDFRICVLDAKDSDLPSLSQLDGLLEEQPLAPPPGRGRGGDARGGRGGRGPGAVYGRLKHGWRNVLLAVVDEGVVSYLRIGEAGFAEEEIYEIRPGRGGKGGGRGRGRGRGRGGRGA